MTDPAPASAAYFDQWYADMRRLPLKDEIAQRCLGLPAHLMSTSLLTWDGIAEVVSALRLDGGATLADLACGRGGYGLEIARRTGAVLIGVDFSAEAVRQAVDNARGQGQPAEFTVGDLAATGLADASAGAVVCIDAIQFAAEPAAVYTEIRRVLRSGGRAVLTCWESVDPDDARVGARLRQVRLAEGLIGAGFTDVEVIERAAWRNAERRMWEEAAALEPGDDPALRSSHDVGVRVLERFDAVRRVLATATAP